MTENYTGSLLVFIQFISDIKLPFLLIDQSILSVMLSERFSGNQEGKKGNNITIVNFCFFLVITFLLKTRAWTEK